MAEASTYEDTIDVNLDDFISPKSMRESFDKHLMNKPTSNGDYFRCAYKSLAICYAKAIEELEKNTNKKYHDIYIVGGGAKNWLLNDLSKKYTEKNIIALPIEATSLGNLKIQMEVE